MERTVKEILQKRFEKELINIDGEIKRFLKHNIIYDKTNEEHLSYLVGKYSKIKNKITVLDDL